MIWFKRKCVHDLFIIRKDLLYACEFFGQTKCVKCGKVITFTNEQEMNNTISYYKEVEFYENVKKKSKYIHIDNP